MKYGTIIIFCCLLFMEPVYAKTDLSISVSDITFSKKEPLEGDLVRVFARVFNLGDTDVYGFVIFTSNNEEIADPQPISIKKNTYDDVFIDWVVTSGIHDVKGRIVSTNPPDNNLNNDNAIKKDYFVDLDTDNDRIGNRKDLDDDGDGISDKEELGLGTDPLKIDTDGDGIGDKHDAFPLDVNESEDTDKDGIGNNADMDNDNDGLDNNKESILGTDPFDSDSDNDEVNDLEDYYPLDLKKWKKPEPTRSASREEDIIKISNSSGSILDKIKATISVDDFNPKNLIIIHVLAVIIIFIFFLYRRKKL